MGAFITNPISLGPRTPAAERDLLAFPGGALLHTGLPNPGLSRVLRRFADRWAQSSLPIWPHLIGSNPDEINQMVRRLEGVEGVMAIELGIPPGTAGGEALEFVAAAFGELPLIVHLPLTAAGEGWLKELPRAGAEKAQHGYLASAVDHQRQQRSRDPHHRDDEGNRLERVGDGERAVEHTHRRAAQRVVRKDSHAEAAAGARDRRANGCRVGARREIDSQVGRRVVREMAAKHAPVDENVAALVGVVIVDAEHTKPAPRSCGSISMTMWPYWPRPPDWRTNLPSCLTALRIVSR